QAASSIRPDVVLMDINLPGIDGITATGKLLEVSPATQVVMLSVQGESDYMRRAMMAGARDYLTKPPSADELLDAIHRMAKLRVRITTDSLSPVAGASSSGGAGSSASREGKVITVFSPKGGTGCTTIAVNTSIALQNLLGAEAKVGLVDLSLQFGDVAIFLKLQPTRTVADLAPRAHELDIELLNTVMIPHPSGLKVLAAPASPEEAETLRGEIAPETGRNRRVEAIISFMRHEFDYLFIDTAHCVDDVTLALLDLSHLILVPTRPIIPEIRGVRSFLALLQKMEYSMDKVGLIINGVDNKRMGIQPEAIERAMMPALIHVPLDERVVLRAANYGVPCVIQESRAQVSQTFQRLAQLIEKRFAVEEQNNEESPAKRAGLGHLL
ncbi:MAG: response regulator, partial [Anaerolineae bacterium]|nr:response regulator [Anaerolineae bacterium]